MSVPVAHRLRSDLDERVRSILLALLESSSKAARRLAYRRDAAALHDFRTLARKMERWLRQGRSPEVRDDVATREFGPFTAGVLREAAAALARRLDAIASPRDEVSLHKAR